MAVYWVDPYREINSSYACHGTTGLLSSRDGSYANPFTAHDLVGSNVTGTFGYIKNTSLAQDDEIRIKGEPLNHIWLSGQGFTRDTIQSVDWAWAPTGSFPSGFSTNDQWTCMLLEPYETSNSSKNYDFYNTTRPLVKTNLRYKTAATGDYLIGRSNERDHYFDTVNRSTYSSLGNTLSVNMRLLDPSFMSNPENVVRQVGTFCYPCGLSSNNWRLLVTDGWSSETTQSSGYYSFLFIRPTAPSSLNYLFNYTAWNCPNTYMVVVDHAYSYNSASTGRSTVRWYEYGPGNNIYATNAGGTQPTTYAIGGFNGFSYIYCNEAQSSTAPTPVTLSFGQMHADVIELYPNGRNYQRSQGNDYDVYLHNLSCQRVLFNAKNLAAWSTTGTTTRGTYHFGEAYTDSYLQGSSTNLYVTGGWSVSHEGCIVKDHNSGIWYGASPANLTLVSGVHNGLSLPFNQADGTSLIPAYPSNGGVVSVSYGGEQLLDLDPTNWYDIRSYSAQSFNNTAGYNWIGEIQVPANTALEDYEPNERGAMTQYMTYIGRQGLNIHSTNIPNDDRMVWFATNYGSGYVICYLNDDGDIEARPVAGSDGTVPTQFALFFYPPIPQYWDANNNPVSTGGVPIMIKSFHGSGDYYQTCNITKGHWGSSGWSGGAGGNITVGSNTYNSTSWTKQSLSYSTSDISNGYLPGPHLSPPTPPVDHCYMRLTFSNPSGNSFAAGMKYLFRVVTPDEWGDY